MCWWNKVAIIDLQMGGVRDIVTPKTDNTEQDCEEPSSKRQKVS